MRIIQQILRKLWKPLRKTKKWFQNLLRNFQKQKKSFLNQLKKLLKRWLLTYQKIFLKMQQKLTRIFQMSWRIITLKKLQLRKPWNVAKASHLSQSAHVKKSQKQNLKWWQSLLKRKKKNTTAALRKPVLVSARVWMPFWPISAEWTRNSLKNWKKCWFCLTWVSMWQPSLRKSCVMRQNWKMPRKLMI